MKTARIITLLLLALLVSPALYAQEGGETVTNEQYGVEVAPPAKWKVVEGSDKAVANFKHSGSQSQIEVVGTRLRTKDVSDVFFETFHKTLAESDFKKIDETSATIGGHEGSKTTYEFKHSDVTLNVVVFEFLRDSTAWLVVGYMQDVEADKYMGDFNAVVESMKFTEGGGGE
jgi:hypothetical protein